MAQHCHFREHYFSMIDEKWESLGLGDFVESPSARIQSNAARRDR